MTAVVMTANYYWAAVLEERKFAYSTLRSSYEEYRKRAGMFWPLMGNCMSHPVVRNE
jgi:protein-S-isoprenylcysteine O-methyltransferase Ste14